MIVKFVTDCNFSGYSRERLIKVRDDESTSDLQSILNDFIQNDIQPCGYFEIIEDENFDESNLDDDFS